MSTNLAAALSLIENFNIFPCTPEKKPTISHWEQNAFNDASKVQTTWSAHPEFIPAIPVGAHHLVVIDADRKPGGYDGVSAFNEICKVNGIDQRTFFVVSTPNNGLHFYFRTEKRYGNSHGSLPAGIDVRGNGGFVIAPGAVMPDGRMYKIEQGTWDTVPALPEALAAYLAPKAEVAVTQPHNAPQDATERECTYAAQALKDEVSKLATLRSGDGRNAALNSAAYSLGTMAGAGWIDSMEIERVLLKAAQGNGHIAKRGEVQTRKTIESGLKKGMEKPRQPLDELPEPEPWVHEMIESWLENYRAKLSKQPTKQQTKRKISLISCASIVPKSVEWLWKGYIPKGKLTLLAGTGGTGKSTLSFNFASTISNGGVWPDGTRCSDAGNVLIWSSEDDTDDTIVPRLCAVGANLNRCGIIAGAVDDRGVSCPFDAGRDMENLREAIRQIGNVSLFIIDPIVTAVTGDMHKANEVRRSLQSIVDFASETNCAVIGITHFAKGTAGKNSAERVIGSQAFSALARMVLVAAKEEDSEKRVFTRAKSNNSADTGGFAYTIEPLTLNNGIETTRVVWGEELHGSSRDILNEVEEYTPEDNTKLGQAKRCVLELMSNGPVERDTLKKYAYNNYGINDRTLGRACKALGVRSIPSGFGEKWIAELPFAAQIAAVKQQ